MQPSEVSSQTSADSSLQTASSKDAEQEINPSTSSDVTVASETANVEPSNQDVALDTSQPSVDDSAVSLQNADTADGPSKQSSDDANTLPAANETAEALPTTE